MLLSFTNHTPVCYRSKTNSRPMSADNSRAKTLCRKRKDDNDAITDHTPTKRRRKETQPKKKCKASQSKTDVRPQTFESLWAWFMKKASTKEHRLIAAFFPQIEFKCKKTPDEMKEIWTKSLTSVVKQNDLINELAILLEALWQKKRDVRLKLCTNWTTVNINLGMDYQLMRIFTSAPKLYYSTYDAETKQKTSDLLCLHEYKVNLKYKSFDCDAKIMDIKNNKNYALRMRISAGMASSQACASWNVSSDIMSDAKERNYFDSERINAFGKFHEHTILWYGMSSILLHRMKELKRDVHDWFDRDSWNIISEYCFMPSVLSSFSLY